jgi:hypothetical protein
MSYLFTFKSFAFGFKFGDVVSVLESLINDWQNFRKALRKEDREAFDRLMDKARNLASAAGVRSAD